MLMDRHGATGERVAKAALLQLPVAIRNRDCIVLSHHALGLNREDPIQIGARGTPERGSFLGRRYCELLVEDRYVVVSQKLVGAFEGCDSGEP